MTDWGAHHFGGATFAVDVRELQPTEVIYHDDKAASVPDLPLPQRHLLTTTSRTCETWQSKARRARSARPSRCRRTRAKGGIYGDFIHCVKTREKPFRDIELAVNTVAVSHLGIDRLRTAAVAEVGRQPSRSSPATPEANRLLDRARREPWLL